MRTITQTGWVYFEAFWARLGYSEEKQYRFVPGPRMADEKDRVAIREVTISFEIPADFDPRAGLVAGLEATKKALHAEFAKRVTEIDRQISELQAIEFNGSPA